MKKMPSLIGKKFKLKDKYRDPVLFFLPEALFGIEHEIKRTDWNTVNEFDKNGKIKGIKETDEVIVEFICRLPDRPYSNWWVSVKKIDLIE